MSQKHKLIRITTVPGSLGGLLKGQLHFMKQHYKVIGVSSFNKGQLDQVAKIEAVPVVAIEMTRKITPLKDLKSVWQLYTLFKKEKPFIVHTHTPKAGTLGMFAAYLAKVPNRLHTIAGLPLLEAVGPKRKLLDYVEKLTYACATKIYPNSFGLKDIILKNGYTNEAKLKVIGNGSSNGIDTEHFNCINFTKVEIQNLKDSLGIKADDFVFLFVGRLVKDKGINELISAFVELNASQSNTKLILVGAYERNLDPLAPEIERQIEEHTCILPLGTMSDVRPYFCLADTLVFPSYREGFPNVVMEAGAMGIPSIVTDINGCNEIVSNTINGLIIPVKSQQHILEAMLKMMQDVGNGAYDPNIIRNKIVSTYDRPTIWNEILKEYKSLE
ncbi:glycosyltransferase family 4 protein [Maribacter sp. CXY002]|uniref:glycosyltransferase family 4 protein n=1 Tax=Maribacter luteocoastalis TaxID=3407671 RepID=UPI003B66FB63